MESRIRVLWLIDSLAAGGAESLTCAILRSADPGRLEIRVVCLKSLGGNPFELDLKRSGFPVLNLRARHLRDLPAFRRLLSAMDEYRPDLVHAHLASASIWAAVACRLRRLPLVTTLHTLPARETWDSRQSLRERLALALMRRYASAVVAVSAAAGEAYRLRYQLGPPRLRVLHNGVDVERLSVHRQDKGADWRLQHGFSSSQTLVSTVAVLRDGKGIEDLLVATRSIVAEFPGMVLLIVGEGPARPRLESAGRELGIDHVVRWLGHRRDVAVILAASDLFVLPSHQEALPTVLLEAMAVGVPAVATSLDSVQEVAGELECVTLVSPSRPELMAQAISALLQDRDRAADLATRARQRVEDAFSIDAWLAGLAELYSEVAGRQQGAPSAGVREA